MIRNKAKSDIDWRIYYKIVPHSIEYFGYRGLRISFL